jgi:D-amino-acid oxidase
MKHRVAVVGAGVSGLTCAVVFAERGYQTAIFAEETGQRTTSAAAAAVWFPYDAEPADAVIAWALETYKILIDLVRDPATGVSMIELGQFSRAGKGEIPQWAIRLGARQINSDEVLPMFTYGFTMNVPLMDTTIYLDYLAERFLAASGDINENVHLEKLEDISPEFDLIVNCAGIGAKTLVPDVDLEPHRGQVIIVPKIDNLSCAIVCDDPPLMYAIPRRNDCVFGGTNELSDNRDIDPTVTSRVVAECSRVLNIDNPKVLAARVGLRPFRKSGVRLERGKLRDGRVVIHNYGHGGSGFTLSWGCAEKLLQIAAPLRAGV